MGDALVKSCPKNHSRIVNAVYEAKVVPQAQRNEREQYSTFTTSSKGLFIVYGLKKASRGLALIYHQFEVPSDAV